MSPDEREARVRMLGAVFEALLAGQTPPRAAALFVGGAGMAWLENGGDLLGDFLKVTGPERSRLTAPRIWQQQQQSVHAQRTKREPVGTMPGIATSEPKP